jgi:hypothetical protein
MPSFFCPKGDTGPAPNVIELQLDLIELSYWIRGDYKAMNQTGQGVSFPGLLPGSGLLTNLLGLGNTTPTGK